MVTCQPTNTASGRNWGVFTGWQSHYSRSAIVVLWSRQQRCQRYRWYLKNLKNEESHFESKAESEVTFLNFCHELIQQSDIAACHRLPKSGRAMYAPLLIRFTDRKIRSRVLSARKQLRETKKEVYINEHLTKTASDIFAAARRLQKDRKILQTWTTNGKVMVKLLDNKTRPIFFKSDLAPL